ncbi:MAG: metal-dependent hydrolase [Acidobacteria bacterium]|nr:metal-dependent hydrolase [Acidobacteriota bacterium]
MPSPIGHLVAGVAVAWTLDPRADRRLIATAAVLAALPDIDLALPFQHRTFTHSIVAVVAVTIIAAVVTRRVTNWPIWRVAAICGIAYGSHLLLDWLSADLSLPRGLQMLWPFSDRFYMSEWLVFALTERRDIFSMPSIVRNVRAVGQELAILGPILYAIWLIRVKAPTRLPAELPRRDHSAK